MRRGEIYLVAKPGGADPKQRRPVVIVSRQVLIDSSYETVVCAPIFSKPLDLRSQVIVGPDNGLKNDSAVHCDGLMSIPKSRLTNYVGELSDAQMVELANALRVAVGLS